VRDLDVEGDLKPPTGRFFGLLACRPRAFARRFQFFCGLGEWRVPGFAVLVDLLEAAGGGGAFGQSEFFVVGFQIRFGGRIVVGVDQRDRLRGRCAGRQLVGGVQILWSQAKGARPGEGAVNGALRVIPSGCLRARAAAVRGTSCNARHPPRPRAAIAHTARTV
jgi:hypothetical protein